METRLRLAVTGFSLFWTLMILDTAWGQPPGFRPQSPIMGPQGGFQGQPGFPGNFQGGRPGQMLGGMPGQLGQPGFLGGFPGDFQGGQAPGANPPRAVPPGVWHDPEAISRPREFEKRKAPESSRTEPFLDLRRRQDDPRKPKDDRELPDWVLLLGSIAFVLGIVAGIMSGRSDPS
jgi:hypothetical protein